VIQTGSKEIYMRTICGTSKARVSSSSRLATLREGLRQKGFSEGATSHISKSVRQSTGTVYEAKWTLALDVPLFP
jgi:hypothetical protein